MASRWQRHAGQPAWVMGVLNCTPDSFSDGCAVDVSRLLTRAHRLREQGANVIDIGGESTRPGAVAVSLEEELQRVLPVIQAYAGQDDVVISIDTMKAEVMQQAIMAGASMVNDISGLTFDDKSLGVVAETGVDVCLMHMLGRPETMQQQPQYTNVLDQVTLFFEQRIQACLDAGIQESKILLDVGIGFGKRLEDNLALIANLARIKARFGLPIVLGASRKSFLGLMTGAEVEEREVETAITSAIGIFCGADMIRVHDCAQQSKTAVVAAKLRDAIEVC